eukprot:CAMPEP_0115884566 /NCGR_PEP_ID=MMETSP0287-20121206/30187_1 /TAXON_ID=412157 /ORGANISM="Chrysochromulina rotalis, Strain UIO044" /LENGTH=60 /DNA_ID=CAMNT_0003340881 /DNA_START=185 /DNA_END=363 /DNA_ORIENTATION=+
MLHPEMSSRICAWDISLDKDFSMLNAEASTLLMASKPTTTAVTTSLSLSPPVACTASMAA